MPPTFWENIKGGRYSVSDVPPRALGPGALLRPRSARAGQDLLAHRRMGPRVRLGSARLEAAHPAEGRRADGRRESGRSSRGPAGPARLPGGRTSDGLRSAWRSSSATRSAARSTTPPTCASSSPSSSASWGRRRASPRCPKAVRESILAEAHKAFDRADARDHRGHHARRAGERDRRPGRQPVQPARARTSRRMRHARPGSPRLARPPTGSRHGTSTRRSPVASTATWASPPSSSSARSARCRRPGPGRSTPARTASSWARARALFVLKRLADAERDGDRIYAVLLGIGGSSATARARASPPRTRSGSSSRSSAPGTRAGVDPATVGLIEAHGTSTRVGDVGEPRR